MLKIIRDLELGFRDAENYRRRENKDLFNSIFLRTPSLERLCSQSTFFLVGEKGTGKTAYAVFLSNNTYKNHIASLRYIRETEYQKFLELKRSKNLTLSDYTNIWKVIIYLLIAQQIREKEPGNALLGSLLKFKAIEKAIDEYYNHAFAPEIIYAVQFAEEARIAAELVAKYSKGSGELGSKVGGESKASLSFSESRFQTNLLFIQKSFEQALSGLKLRKNHLLFIDGIDIRPSSIPYEDYLECVKGLANAIWSVNNDFFANIKDSPGRLRVVLLVRPDIFASLGLQNQNGKIQDNSVVLNWGTTYPEHRRSNLFLMIDQLLSCQQQENLAAGEAWDYYFPYDSSHVLSQMASKSSFITFLRYSLHRPRNILAMLVIQKENFIEENRPDHAVFSGRDVLSPAFTRKYSEFLLGEVKDLMAFYHTDVDYEIFLKFFQYLNGHSRFTYNFYLSAFKNFEKFINRSHFPKPSFCESPDSFLQFLYDLDVLGYIDETDNEPFFGWCHRERSPSNIAPKVKTHVRYDIHYGLMKALGLGKPLNTTN